MLVIRADGNTEIGSGHVMRCSTIAREVKKLGHDVSFVVSDEQSASLVEANGFQAHILGGSFSTFAEDDGIRLAQLVDSLNADVLLVDSYAVSDAFFEGLGSPCSVAYIDDLYSFTDGFLERPRKWLVDQVVNYSFGISEDDYREVYGSDVGLYIGPSFAPVREEFACCKYSLSEQISRVLVTSGGTNPNCTLEKMVQACLDVLPDVQVDVVVGRMASFDAGSFSNGCVHIHKNVQDMASLMQNANLAISAAGSTLYELCCVGVPTIAVPIVENQLVNAGGFAASGLGVSCLSTRWSTSDISDLVRGMVNSAAQRKAYSGKARQAVDGSGAARIARMLVSG